MAEKSLVAPPLPPSSTNSRQETGPELALDPNSELWLDNLHNKATYTVRYNTNGENGDTSIPFESPLWYRNKVPESIEAFVRRDVFSDVYAAIADSRREATKFSKIMRAVICLTTGFFPILFMKKFLELHEFKRSLKLKMKALNKLYYEGKAVLSFDAESAIFKPSMLQRTTITPTREPDYKLGNESLANASPFNNNFNVIIDRPQVAVSVSESSAGHRYNSKKDDAQYLDGRKVVYPVHFQNTGGVNPVNNNFKRSLQKYQSMNPSPPRNRLSSLSVPVTTEIPASEGKTLSSKDMIPSPRPPTRQLSPERRASPRMTSLKRTPSNSGASINNHESKAVPSSPFETLTTATTKSDIEIAMMKDHPFLQSTSTLITPPRPPPLDNAKTMFPTPTARSV